MSSKLKVNKEEKYNHSRPLNCENIKKYIIEFTYTIPRNVSAKKDVVETFTFVQKSLWHFVWHFVG